METEFDEATIVEEIVPDYKDVTTFASGAGVSLIGKVLGRGTHIIGQIVLARFLGPDVFGLYAIGWTIMSLIGIIAPLGLQNGVVRFGSEYWKKDDSRLKSVLVQSISIAIVFGLFIGLIEFIAAPLIEHAYKKDGLTNVIRWFALAIPFLAGLKVVSAATRITQRMKFSVIAEDIGQPIVSLLLIGIVYITGIGLLGAVAAEAFSFLIAVLIALEFLRKLYSKTLVVKVIAHQSTKDLLRFSFPTVLTGMFSLLVVWTSRLLIGFFRPAADVGIYQAVSQSSTLFAIILWGINAMFTPMIARLYHNGEIQRLNNLYKVSTKWGLYLSLPAFLTIFFASKELMVVIFGPKYIVGYLPLVILSIGQLINVGTGAVGYMLIMTGRQNDWLMITCLAWIINSVLNLMLIPKFGILGSAIATSVSVSLLFIVGLIRVKIKLNMWPYDWRYRKGIIATVIAGLLLGLLNLISIDIYIIKLIMVILISCVVFVLTLAISGLEPEDKAFVNIIRFRLGI